MADKQQSIHTGSGTSILKTLKDMGDGSHAEVVYGGGNVDGVVAALIAASVSTIGVDQLNIFGRGLKLIIDITAITGTAPTLTVTVQGKDSASGKYYTQLVSVPLTAVGTTVLEIYPGIVAAANVAANTTVPRQFRVNCAIGGTTPTVTATVGVSMIR